MAVAGIFNAAIFNNEVFNTGSVVPGPTIFYQGDGIDRKKKRKKRREQTKELFDAIERTIYETLHPPEPVLPTATQERTVVDESRPRLAAHLDQLAAMAKDNRDLAARLRQVRQAVATYQAAQDRAYHDNIEQDDEETMMVLF